MVRNLVGTLLIAPAMLLAYVGSTSAAVVGDPSGLSASSVVIDFESLPVGTSEPIIIGGVTISTFDREGTNDPREIAAQRSTQYPGIFEGQFFGMGRHDFRIEFATPVSQAGLGVFDPNYDGNALLAFDAMGDLIDIAVSAAGDPNFPTGPVGGSHSTFVGFVRPTADIARIELWNIFNPAEGKTDLLGIDSIRYFAGGGTVVIPEPGSIVLLAIGCLGLGAVWHRQRRSEAA